MVGLIQTQSLGLPGLTQNVVGLTKGLLNLARRIPSCAKCAFMFYVRCYEERGNTKNKQRERFHSQSHIYQSSFDTKRVYGKATISHKEMEGVNLSRDIFVAIVT